MVKQSPKWKEIHKRPQQGRIRFQEQRNRPGQRQGLAHGNLKTRQTGFPNWTIRFLQPRPEATIKDYHARDSSSTSLVPSQRRRIQWMRAQKMREEASEKERDEYFNIIWPVILTKQEWRVNEKVNTLVPMTSDNDMDLLDDDEALLIKDGSPPPTGMDINMVFMLPTESRGI
jgi:hypothetical protein